MSSSPARIAVSPVQARLSPSSHAHIVDAVVAGGGEVVELAEADGLIWRDVTDPAGLAAALEQAPRLRWVQLPMAGIDRMRPLLTSDRVWTSAKTLYSEPIAEYVLATVLAQFRSIPAYVADRTWTVQPTRTLIGANVTILGGGGIASALIEMLQPWRCRITVVRRAPRPMPGTASVVAADRLIEAVRDADLVVVALALTEDTAGIIDATVLEAMPARSWLVNVARGPHVDTDALLAALRSGSIGGAILDVTDPEPLPAAHPLWGVANCLVTPHWSCPVELAEPYLLARVTENVARFAAGEPLQGLVDVAEGY